MGSLLAGLASGAGMAGAGGVMGGLGNMFGQMMTGSSGSAPQAQPAQQLQTQSQDPSSITVNPQKSSYDPGGNYGIAPWHQFLLDSSQGVPNGSR